LAEVLENWLPTKQVVQKETEAPTVRDPGADELAVWDKDAMMERLMGDEELARKIIGVFIEDISAQIEKLGQFIESGDMEGVELQAHTIKGAAANVGGDALQQIACSIERAGEAGRVDDAVAGMEELKRRYGCLEKAIMNDA